MKYCNKLLYVGAGHHIEPVTHFPETKYFVFIDSQPRSEIDSMQPKFNKDFYRPNFINKLVSSCSDYGFILESYTVLDKTYHKKIFKPNCVFSLFYKIPQNINPALMIFYNKYTQQELKYYISTNIKFNMNVRLENDISTCDGIMVSGYFPENEILNYFVRPKAFFGYTNNNYVIEKNSENNSENNIIKFLHMCVCNIPYYFTDFYVVYHNSGIIVSSTDFTDFIKMNEEYNKINNHNSETKSEESC